MRLKYWWLHRIAIFVLCGAALVWCVDPNAVPVGVVVSLFGIACGFAILDNIEQGKQQTTMRTQAEAAGIAADEMAEKYAWDDTPCLFVHCDFNPDKVKVFMEVPDELIKHVRKVNPELTFVECLAELATREGESH